MPLIISSPVRSVTSSVRASPLGAAIRLDKICLHENSQNNDDEKVAQAGLVPRAPTSGGHCADRLFQVKTNRLETRLRTPTIGRRGGPRPRLDTILEIHGVARDLRLA